MTLPFRRYAAVLLVALSVLLGGATPAAAAGPTYISGYDVSRWNVHTPSAKNRGFGFARATYASYEDDRFRYHMANMAKGHLVRGAYAFGVGWQDPVKQARKFLSVTKNADLLVLDLERDTLGKSMTNAQASHFIYVVHQAGRKIGLYHSRSVFPNLGQDFNWVAQWSDFAPRGIEWAFWQYQGHPLDLDVFRGTKAALLKLEDPYVAPVPAKTIAKVRLYISRLAAVGHPTTSQVHALALYRARLKSYLSR